MIVNLYANYKMLEARNNRRPDPDAKYYELWEKANGGPPKRGERMTASVFQGYWKIRVRWSKKKKTGKPGGRWWKRYWNGSLVDHKNDVDHA